MIDILARELLLVAVALVTDATAPTTLEQQQCTATSPVTTTCPRTAADEVEYEELIKLRSMTLMKEIK